jgi:hypothetical protein
MPADKTAHKTWIPEQTFDSWSDFKARFNSELFGDKPFERGRFLFRGHRLSTWSLQPTFDRMFSELKGNRFTIAREMVQTFKRALEGFDVPEEVRRDDHAVLALGQHYGLPTRLLDWTESPYVAAFFAYNASVLWSSGGEEQIAIWVLDPQDPIWQPDNGVEIIEAPQLGNKRLRNQAGKFTLQKTPSPSLEKFVSDLEPTTVPLRKFLLPSKDAFKAIADLDAMGIHHGAVYPEVEGAAQMVLYRAVVKLKTALATTSTPRPV